MSGVDVHAVQARIATLDPVAEVVPVVLRGRAAEQPSSRAAEQPIAALGDTTSQAGSAATHASRRR